MPDSFPFVNIDPTPESDRHILVGCPMRIAIKGRVAYIVKPMHCPFTFARQFDKTYIGLYMECLLSVVWGKISCPYAIVCTIMDILLI